MRGRSIKQIVIELQQDTKLESGKLKQELNFRVITGQCIFDVDRHKFQYSFIDKWKIAWTKEKLNKI